MEDKTTNKNEESAPMNKEKRIGQERPIDIQPDHVRINSNDQTLQESPEKSPVTLSAQSCFSKRRRILIAIFAIISTLVALSVLLYIYLPKNTRYRSPEKYDVIYSTSSSEGNSTEINMTIIVTGKEGNMLELLVLLGHIQEVSLRNLRGLGSQEDSSPNNDSLVIFQVEVDTSIGRIVSFKAPVGTNNNLIHSVRALVTDLLVSTNFLKKVENKAVSFTETHGNNDYQTTYSLDETDKHHILDITYKSSQSSRRLEASGANYADVNVQKKFYISKTTGAIESTETSGSASLNVTDLQNDSNEGNNQSMIINIQSRTYFRKTNFQITESFQNALDRLNMENVDLSSQNASVTSNDTANNNSPGNVGRGLLFSQSINQKLFSIFGESVNFQASIQQDSSNNFVVVSSISIGSLLTESLPVPAFSPSTNKKILQVITLKNTLESTINSFLADVNQFMPLLNNYQTNFPAALATITAYVNSIDLLVNNSFAAMNTSAQNYIKLVTNATTNYTNHLLKNSSQYLSINNGTFNWTPFFNSNQLLSVKSIVETPLMNTINIIIANLTNLNSMIVNLTQSFLKNATSFWQSVDNRTSVMNSSALNLNNLSSSNIVNSGSSLLDFSAFENVISQIKNDIVGIANVSVTVSVASASSALQNLNKINRILNITTWTNTISTTISNFKTIEGKYNVKLDYGQVQAEVVNATASLSNQFVQLINTFNSSQIIPNLINNLNQYALPKLTGIQSFESGLLKLLFSAQGTNTDLSSFSKSWNINLDSIDTPIGVIIISLQFTLTGSVNLQTLISASNSSFIVTPSGIASFVASGSWNFVLGAVGASASVSGSANMPIQAGLILQNNTFYISGTLVLNSQGQAGVFYQLLTVSISSICTGGWIRICIPYPTVSLGSQHYIISVTYTISNQVFSVIPFQQFKIA